MSGLHLIRLPLRLPELLRFAAEHGVTRGDDGLGYTLHLWLTALFGDLAPKPFRFMEARHEVLGYATADSTALLQHAQAFAAPIAWAALDVEGVASKPMPAEWRAGLRLRMTVLACPVTRRGDVEKDAYLHALDRLGNDAPPRGEVYRQWFVRQWRETFEFEHVALQGMRARASLARRARASERRLKEVQRPQALFAAQGCVRDPEGFGEQIRRGIGRHRAFGFGMVLLSPPS